MSSRMYAISAAVQAHITTAFTNASLTVTIVTDPESFATTDKSAFPRALVLFEEEEPERLDFKQQRRRVNGEVHLGVFHTTREAMDALIEGIRDLIVADDTLGGLVDYTVCEAGQTFSGPEDPLVYGQLDVSTEEVF